MRSLITSITILCGSIFLSGCQATLQQQISAKEFETFTAVIPSKRQMNGLKIYWEIRDDTAAYCTKDLVKNKSPGWQTSLITPPLACARWNVSQNTCTIITTSKTSHTILGHELRHCFEGHFH